MKRISNKQLLKEEAARESLDFLKLEFYQGKRKELSGGSLIELAKYGRHTVVYMSVIEPNARRAWRLHTRQTCKLAIIEGMAEVLIYAPRKRGKRLLWALRSFRMDAAKCSRLVIPPLHIFSILCGSQSAAKIVNAPFPAYDPNLKGERVEFTEKEVDKLPRARMPKRG